MGANKTRPAPKAAKGALPAPARSEKGGGRKKTGLGPKPSFVVGIGGGAGSVEALVTLFKILPADSGMAFLVHCAASAVERGRLAEELGDVTAMPVVEVTEASVLRPSRVYLLPQDATLHFSEGAVIPEVTRPEGLAPRLPVDRLLRGLARSRKSRAIGMVLSGAGSDGSLGIQAIKAEGGLTFAQDLRDAKADGMPMSAVSTGCIDFMLGMGQLATGLLEVARRARAAKEQRAAGEDDLRRILGLVRAAYEVDLTHAPRATIERRVERRMTLSRAETLADYLHVLRERPMEVEALHQDLLVRVGHFFRDPGLFEVLRRRVVPSLLRSRAADAPIRVWVPGCGAGEEVYSIAITLAEALSQHRVTAPFQIFATDVSEAALEKARAGAYLENVAIDLSPELLRRHFVKNGKLYQVSQALRDACVFSRQDLTRDPPSDKLDLISCRNVRLELSPVLERRVVPLYHHALRSTGYLLLGSRDGTEPDGELFQLVDDRRAVYAKAITPASQAELARAEGRLRPPRPLTSTADVHAAADRLMVERYAPAGVIIDSDLQIVQFRGRVGAYLEPAAGEASLNVLKMARDGLMLELRAAIQKARSAGAAVRSAPVEVEAQGRRRAVIVDVTPLGEAGEGDGAGTGGRCFLVLFEEQAPPAVTATETSAQAELRAARLEQELAAAREYLRVTVEEQEATGEELRAANDELLSSNEELQCINEELEMAREQLASTNEELTTLNGRLADRNRRLGALAGDLEGLLASVDIPIVMVDERAQVARFTPGATRVLHLRASDVGRPFADVRPRFERPDLVTRLEEVRASGIDQDLEVRDEDARRYELRLRPRRAQGGTIEGVVLLFLDLDRRRAEGGSAGDEVVPAPLGP